MLLSHNVMSDFKQPSVNKGHKRHLRFPGIVNLARRLSVSQVTLFLHLTGQRPSASIDAKLEKMTRPHKTQR